MFRAILLNFVHHPTSGYESHSDSQLSSISTFTQTGYGEIPTLWGPKTELLPYTGPAFLHKNPGQWIKSKGISSNTVTRKGQIILIPDENPT